MWETKYGPPTNSPNDYRLTPPRSQTPRDGRRRSEDYHDVETLAISDMLTQDDGTSIDAPDSFRIRCRNSKCGNTATLQEARESYKSCHNCHTWYCCRECRRIHWSRHRRVCMQTKAMALCNNIVFKIRDEVDTLVHLSKFARQGYLSRGRGCVKLFFSNPEASEEFLRKTSSDKVQPCYLPWQNILHNEMCDESYRELIEMSQSYNPESRFILYVAVCIQNEFPSSSSTKWERKNVTKCAKIRLSAAVAVCEASPKCQRRFREPSPLHMSDQQQQQPLTLQQFPPSITRDLDNQETMILTSMTDTTAKSALSSRAARELCLQNIEKFLTERGVNLAVEYPEVHEKLCRFVENNEKFTSMTIYPRDLNTGETFMCVLMPGLEPHQFKNLPPDGNRIRTYDIGAQD